MILEGRRCWFAAAIVVGLASVAYAVTWETASVGSFYTTASVEDPVIRENARAGLWINGASGFLISPDGYFLTNYHVGCDYGVDQSCLPSEVAYVGYTDSGYQYRIVGSLVDADMPHDFALYKANASNLPAVRCRTESTPLPVGSEVCLIGHPNSWPQRVSFGTVLTADTTALAPRLSFEYTAQTEPGSSGSAVFARDGRCVGLHWGWDAGGALHGRLTGIPMHRLLEVASIRDVVLSRTAGDQGAPANPPGGLGITADGVWAVWQGALDRAGAASAIDLVLDSGNTTTLVMEGDASADFDLYLLDDQGHVVADARSPSSSESIVFPVPASGVYRVVVISDRGSGTFTLWARN